jgi:ring-1,2-phenylacetyl-CoA epoxidase subunit PaaC
VTAIERAGSPTPGTERAGSAAALALVEPTRTALAELLLTMADDEFVSGFTDSEWTGIAPLLEEDVAISSISQDELGHARALYQLVADVVADGRDEDALAYDREPDEYRHARLLDQPRGDWADTIARRFLYELADEARLSSIGGGYRALADLVEKLRREERYHRMHVLAWIERLAQGGPEPRRRLEAALTTLGTDAPTVFTPLAGEAALLDAGILTRGMAAAEAAWRADLTSILVPLGLALPPEVHPSADGRQGHSDSFRWLWGEFTMVRRSEDGATW